MHLHLTGNAPLDPNLHSVQDALHATHHETGQKAHHGAVTLSHKQNTAPSQGALGHQKLYALPPKIAKHLRTSDESGGENTGELLEKRNWKSIS